MQFHNIVCVLLLVFWSGIVQSHDARGATTIGELPLEKIATNIYLVHAPLEAPNENNEGFIANTGFIVTTSGVIVIDPGSSLQIGRKLMQKISEVTSKPVVAVFNTHVHGDHWLGNQAVKEKFPDAVIYAHERMIARVSEGEGKLWLEIMDNATKGATAGTEIVPPSVGLKGGEVLDFGNEKLRIYYRGKAHTDNDIMIELDKQNTIFLGDVVMVGRISSQPQDGDITGQISAIEFALNTDNEIFVPGHGRSGGKEVPRKAHAFMTDLYGSVRRYFDEGLSDFEIKEKVVEDLSDYKHWSGFERIGKTISYTFLKIEEEAF